MQSNTEIVNINVSDNLSVVVIKDTQNEWLMSSEDVANGYGVKRNTLSTHKSLHKDEMKEGSHWIKGIEKTDTLNKQYQPNEIFWTKAGVIRLGFFIKSERAKMFRDWAEQVILEKMEPQLTAPKVTLPKAKRINHNRLSKDRLVEILSLVALVDEKEVRTALVKKLMPELDIPAIQLQLPFEVKGGNK